MQVIAGSAPLGKGITVITPVEVNFNTEGAAATAANTAPAATATPGMRRDNVDGAAATHGPATSTLTSGVQRRDVNGFCVGTGGGALMLWTRASALTSTSDGTATSSSASVPQPRGAFSGALTKLQRKASTAPSSVELVQVSNSSYSGCARVLMVIVSQCGAGAPAGEYHSL